MYRACIVETCLHIPPCYMYYMKRGALYRPPCNTCNCGYGGGEEGDMFLSLVLSFFGVGGHWRCCSGPCLACVRGLGSLFIGNIGNKSSAPHDDHVDAVTDRGGDTVSGADLLPMGKTASSASPRGGGHVVTVVTVGRYMRRPRSGSSPDPPIRLIRIARRTDQVGIGDVLFSQGVRGPYLVVTTRRFGVSTGTVFDS